MSDPADKKDDPRPHHNPAAPASAAPASVASASVAPASVAPASAAKPAAATAQPKPSPPTTGPKLAGSSNSALDYHSVKPEKVHILSPWEKKLAEEAKAAEAKAAEAAADATAKPQPKPTPGPSKPIQNQARLKAAAGKAKPPPPKPKVPEKVLTQEEKASAFLSEIENVYARRNPDKVKLVKSRHVRVRRHPKGPPPSPRLISKPSKSHKSVVDESSSSDEEWTHIPYSELRDYVSQAPDESKKPPPPPPSGDYVDLEIIADPKEPGIRSWVETYTHRLYVYWIIMVTISCLLAAICLYMFQFLKKVYSQEILLDLFWMSNYANVVAVVFCSMLTAFLGIFFLCYPSPQVWRSMKTTRWVIITMPQIVLLIAHADQLRLLAMMPDIERQLLSKMEADVRFSASGSMLVNSTQGYFQCCGVHGYKDWKKLDDFEFEGYPQTCCNGKFFMGCEIPMTKKDLIVRVPHLTKDEPPEKPQDQIYTIGCYKSERTMLRAVFGIVVSITMLITYSSFAATLLMWNVIGHTNVHSVVVFHPFSE